MAPITDQMVDELKGTIAKLEARVHELEGKLHQKASGGSAESMQMILIGPPGAGMSYITIVLSSWKIVPTRSGWL